MKNIIAITILLLGIIGGLMTGLAVAKTIKDFLNRDSTYIVVDYTSGQIKEIISDDHPDIILEKEYKKAYMDSHLRIHKRIKNSNEYEIVSSDQIDEIDVEYITIDSVNYTIIHK